MFLLFSLDFYNVFKKVKVARLAKSMIQIPFIMGYAVGLGMQNPELKILFQSDIRLLRYEWPKSGKSTTLATTFFLFSSFLSKSSCQYGG